jgi:hypothetical protein
MNQDPTQLQKKLSAAQAASGFVQHSVCCCASGIVLEFVHSLLQTLLVKEFDCVPATYLLLHLRALGSIVTLDV